MKIRNLVVPFALFLCLGSVTQSYAITVINNTSEKILPVIELIPEMGSNYWGYNTAQFKSVSWIPAWYQGGVMVYYSTEGNKGMIACSNGSGTAKVYSSGAIGPDTTVSINNFSSANNCSALGPDIKQKK